MAGFSPYIIKIYKMQRTQYINTRNKPSDHIKSLTCIHFYVSDYEDKVFRNIFPQNQPVPHITDNLSTVRSNVMQKKAAKEGTTSESTK